MREENTRKSELLLWLAVFGPSAVWMAHLASSFMLAAYSCEQGKLLMHSLTFAAMALIALFLYGGWLSRRFFCAEKGDKAKSKSFIALLALMLGSLLLLTVFVSDISNVLLEPCL